VRKECFADFRAVAEEAACAAGRLLVKRMGTLQRSQVTRKAASDYVTVLDRAAERVILRAIRRRFPGHGIQAEESGLRGEASAYRWIIDPLDGTTNYIHQFPAFCVSIALACEGTVVVGVIFDPLRGELFHAVRGGGAWCNRRRIRVTPCRRMRECLLATGFPFRIHARLEEYLRSFRKIFWRTSGIRRTGSAALDLAYTACGRVDGFWEMGLSAWDMAAGALLVEEAAGCVSDFAGKDTHLALGSIVAANPVIHPQLVRLLRPLFPRGW